MLEILILISHNIKLIMNTVCDLLRIASEEDRVEFLTFLEHHDYTSEIKFTFSHSKIVDLVSKIIREKNMNLFDRLMKYDFDINTHTTNGSTLLHIAIEYALIEYAEKLLKKGANISLRNESNQSILFKCFNGRSLTDDIIKCVEFLIKAGADIEHLKGTGNNSGYYIALFLKQKIFPENIGSDPSDKKIIQIVTNSKCPRFITKIMGKIELRFIDNNVLQQISICENIGIELPLSGEKILGHLLPVGMIINGMTLIKPMMCRFIDDIFTTDSEMVSPESIYF